MKIKSWTIWMVLSTGLVWSCGVLQNDKPTQTITIDIDAKAPLVPIQPTMFGIFWLKTGPLNLNIPGWVGVICQILRLGSIPSMNSLL